MILFTLKYTPDVTYLKDSGVSRLPIPDMDEIKERLQQEVVGAYKKHNTLR